MQNKIIKLAAFLGGIYFVVYFLLPETILTSIGITSLHESISYGFILIGAAAIGVGIINLIMVHGKTLLYLQKDWFYSGALLFGLFSMLTLSLFDWRQDLAIASKIQTAQTADHNADTQALSQSLQKEKESGIGFKLFTLLNESFFVALGSAMFSLLGVYIAAAAFRAFRVKTVESALMMCAAIIVMLGQIPFGLWISKDLPEIRLWLLQVPNGAAFRAIRLGAAVAGLLLSIRIWLSLDTRKV